MTLVLAFAGLLFTTSAKTSHGTTLRSDRSDLPGLIRAEQDRVNARLHRVTTMRREIDAATRSLTRDNGPLGRAHREIDRLDEVGGLAPVTGRAIRVSLDDAPRGGAKLDGVSPDALVVHQQDVQAVVNALWLGGAEAMMLQDQRVISTSAVRCVGNTLNLQGRVYGPPYVITAIGDIRAMRDSLDRNPSVAVYQNYVKMFRLGWKVETVDSVTMPAFDGALELEFAAMPTTVTPSQGPTTPSGTPSGAPEGPGSTPSASGTADGPGGTPPALGTPPTTGTAPTTVTPPTT